MNNKELKTCIENGFEKTKSDILKHNGLVTNSEKSGRFIQRVSEEIYDTFFEENLHVLNVVRTNFSRPNDPGEWLLDACITDFNPKLSQPAKKIHVAIECESQTGLCDFNQDFAKLVHLYADHKLYLQGLNQKTADGANKHINDKMQYILDWLSDTESTIKSNEIYYVAFWPSPENKDGKSIWNQLQDAYSHLDQIRLYRVDGPSRNTLASCTKIK